VSCWATVIIILAFDITVLRSSLGGVILLLLLYGPSTSAFVCLLSYAFTDQVWAQSITIYLNIFLGVALPIVMFVLRVIQINGIAYLSYLFRLFPTFCLGDGLISIITIQTYSFMSLPYGETYSVMSLEIAGADVLFLALDLVVYMAITLLIDMYPGGVHKLKLALGLERWSGPAAPEADDDDVAREREAALALGAVGGGGSNGNVVVVRDLRVVYPGGKSAIRGLSLLIPPGQCFGLLGINGAGKTSLLKVLTGEQPPTAGAAMIAGLDVASDMNAARKLIGFCPQFDALFSKLTGREHLTFYARVKGVPEGRVAPSVQRLIDQLGLAEYADRLASTYR
jgi:ATP-binding cassette, subfamily A (ABC1), member 3